MSRQGFTPHELRLLAAYSQPITICPTVYNLPMPNLVTRLSKFSRKHSSTPYPIYRDIDARGIEIPNDLIVISNPLDIEEI